MGYGLGRGPFFVAASIGLAFAPVLTLFSLPILLIPANYSKIGSYLHKKSQDI